MLWSYDTESVIKTGKKQCSVWFKPYIVILGLSHFCYLWKGYLTERRKERVEDGSSQGVIVYVILLL